jgi:hypothetical protein
MMNACSCDCCDHWDYLNGECDLDDQQHPPDDACKHWEKPVRRNPMTGEKFKEADDGRRH